MTTQEEILTLIETKYGSLEKMNHKISDTVNQLSRGTYQGMDRGDVLEKVVNQFSAIIYDTTKKFPTQTQIKLFIQYEYHT